MKSRPSTAISIQKSIFVRNSLINLAFIFSPIIAASIYLPTAALANPLSTQCWLGVVTMFIGYGALVVSKLPQIAEFDLTTFGVAGLPRKNQRLYMAGYAIMFAGFVVILTS